MSLVSIIAAVGGGIFGSLIGGTLSFIFTGITAFLGFAVLLATGESMILDQIAFGPFFGPQVAFVGACAAAAYAGRVNKMNGQDVNHPLFVTKDVVALLIGGLFGVLGYVTNYYLATFDIGIDTVAATVVIFGLITRFVVSGGSLISHYEQDQKWTDGLISELAFNLIWGLGLSLIVGFAVIETGLANFGWAISAISLIFLFTTVEGFPVTHHVTMVAGYAAITFNNIYLAGLFGVLSILLGEFFLRTTNTNVKSHLDMPAIVITLLSFIILTFFQ